MALFGLAMIVLYISGWAWENGYENQFIIAGLISWAITFIVLAMRGRL